MSLRERLARSSTFTALGACFFTAGLILLFVVLFHETMRSGPALIITGVLFIGAVASWAASAQVRNVGN
jgi:hypothetical protein